MPRTPPVLLLLLLLAGMLAGGIAPRVQAAQTATLLAGPDVGAFEATPDLALVAFNRSQSFNGPPQVSSVSIGGGATTSLSPPSTSAGLLLTTADSQSVVYVVGGNAPEAGLYLAPIGGGDSVRLNAPVPPPDVLALAYASPDRRYVLYLVGPDSSNSGSALYSVALDTRQALRLTPPSPAGERIRLWFITTDSRSIFIRQQRSAGISTVYVIPIDGGPPRELVPDLLPNTSLDLLGISADNQARPSRLMARCRRAVASRNRICNSRPMAAMCCIAAKAA